MPMHDVWRSVDILGGLAAALGTLAAEDDCAQHALVHVTPPRPGPRGVLTGDVDQSGR